MMLLGLGIVSRLSTNESEVVARGGAAQGYFILDNKGNPNESRLLPPSQP